MDAESYTLFRDTLLSLKPSEKHSLMKELRADIYGADPNPDINEMLTGLREVRCNSGLACPHCGCKSVIRSGFYSPPKQPGVRRQRYRCKDEDCRKTFNDLTASPYAGTHYPERWAQYLDCMVRRLSLRKAAKEISIHVSTAFFWRHKVLTAIRKIAPESLTGIVEADTTYYLEARKGKYQVKRRGGRKARKCGGVGRKRGISADQACILVAMDREKHIVSKFSGMGRINHVAVDNIVTPHLSDVTTLCTDMESAFAAYAKKQGLPHETINASKGEHVKKVIYHIQNVNSYHTASRVG